MNDIPVEAGIAVILFASTNIDDVFVLIAFLADRRFKTREVVSGQYVGILVLTVGSILLSLFLKTIPGGYAGLLGLIPLGLGIRKLISKEQDDDDEASASGAGRWSKVLAVAVVTIANGGDNVGVYVPLFATKPQATLVFYLAVFMVLTAVWCRSALYLIHHRSIGAYLRRITPPIIPWVFIGLGGYILWESEVIGKLASLF